jgi:uncharacterized membrane protein
MRKIALYLLSFLFVLAGIYHFTNPAPFVKIVPSFLPAPLAIVYISGICEIVFGTMLQFHRTRNAGAWLIILLLIAVFPANIKMAVDFYEQHNPYLWAALLRLPLQFVLIWWAWHYTDSGSVDGESSQNADKA